MPTNKKKILNDPVYGFITLPGELMFDLVEHPYFQRLRRIKQLGLSEYVYPGALHTRFHHALGAMHLMGQAIQTLRSKGHVISDDECEAAQVAILLHDIGHGPFSHVLECCILENVPHEEISLLLMRDLNRQFGGALSLAIQMFEGSYERPFFHQLISSQLDMDRMDYLNRDSFYSGVAEGTIGAERLIKLLDLVDDSLVVEEKGILSVENFLNARRIMYWQVYLHKTSICVESMLIQVLRRARHLTGLAGLTALDGTTPPKSLFAPPRFWAVSARVHFAGRVQYQPPLHQSLYPVRRLRRVGLHQVVAVPPGPGAVGSLLDAARPPPVQDYPLHGAARARTGATA